MGEQKRALRSKARDKQRRVARLRRTLIEARKAILEAESELASAEESDLQLQDSLAKLEEKSNNILKREMQALGVLNSVDSEQEIALAEPNFAWSNASMFESVDWEDLLREPSDILK